MEETQPVENGLANPNQAQEVEEEEDGGLEDEAKDTVKEQIFFTDDKPVDKASAEESREDEEEKDARFLRNDSAGRDPEKLNMITRLLAHLHEQRTFLFTSLIIVVMWSCFCAGFADHLADKAAADPGGAADHWLTWLESGGSKFRMVGILFVFAVVFRFNRCYDRWNQGRVVWGKLISVSLDLTRMASYWMVDPAYSDALARFVVVFAYASKALLRGNSLADAEEEGHALVERGYLKAEELVDMENLLGWQTHYCLDMMGAILIEAHYSDKAFMFDTNHKVHSQLFRAIDGNISQLGATIGEAIRLRASGLPETYDGLHHVVFYFYFLLAPVFYAATIGWVLPFMICLESLLILAFVTMGSDLVQPFGTDRVDLPLEFFCETIELQTDHIRERVPQLQELARAAIQKSSPTASNANIHKVGSLGRRIKEDVKPNETKVPTFKAPKLLQMKRAAKSEGRLFK